MTGYRDLNLHMLDAIGLNPAQQLIKAFCGGSTEQWALIASGHRMAPKKRRGWKAHKRFCTVHGRIGFEDRKKWQGYRGRP